MISTDDRSAAIISGAGGGGIGTSIFRALKEAGLEVYSIERTDSGRRLLLELFPSADNKVFVGDIGNWKTVEHVKQTLDGQGKRCRIVVHNAARGSPFCDPSDIKEKDISEDFSDILYGAINLVRAFSPDVCSATHGRFVFISSSAAIRGSWGRGLSYATAKSGLHGLSNQLALQLAHHQVTSNVVVPFQTLTPRVMRNGRRTEQEVLDNAKEDCPLMRPGYPSDVAGLVRFLVSQEADYITGQIFNVDGGQLLAPRRPPKR